MKNKNDFQSDNATPDVVQPIACLYCHHKEFEEVQIHAPQGSFINRIAEMTLVGKLFPGWARHHRLYGWRCIYCGYVMWFTARNLD